MKDERKIKWKMVNGKMILDLEESGLARYKNLERNILELVDNNVREFNSQRDHQVFHILIRL